MTQTAAASLADVDVTLMLFEPAGEFYRVRAENGRGPEKGRPGRRHHQQGGPALRFLPRWRPAASQVEAFGAFDKVLTLSAKDGTGCDALFDRAGPLRQPRPPLLRRRRLHRPAGEGAGGRAGPGKGAAVPAGGGPPRRRRARWSPSRSAPTGTWSTSRWPSTCEKKSHKGMVIGKGGQMLKKIATAARLDCEELLGTKVNLQCWVKVREGLARQRAPAGQPGICQSPDSLILPAQMRALRRALLENFPAAPVRQTLPPGCATLGCITTSGRGGGDARTGQPGRTMETICRNRRYLVLFGL